MRDTLANELSLFVALTEMDSERRAEFIALVARVRRMEQDYTWLKDTLMPEDKVVFVDFVNRSL